MNPLARIRAFDRWTRRAAVYRLVAEGRIAVSMVIGRWNELME
jgi:hypothetical protein